MDFSVSYDLFEWGLFKFRACWVKVKEQKTLELSYLILTKYHFNTRLLLKLTIWIFIYPVILTP